MSNSIDLGKIYGIGSCPEDGCVDTGVINPNIPSLEQIAAYNIALSKGIQILPEYPDIQSETLKVNPSGSETDNKGTHEETHGGTPNTIPYFPPEDFVPTPSTTIGYDKNLPKTEALTQEEKYNQMNSGINGYSDAFPVTSESIQFLNGFIRTQIGRHVQVDFLVGSNTITTKNGYLLGVGANYILINELDTNDITACDFYNIKFIRIYY